MAMEDMVLNQEKVIIKPPCQAACPLYQDVRDYLAAITKREFERAVEIIRKTNPLPFICATICAHPCESECRRNTVDAALSIRSLKRAAMDFGNIDPPKDKTGSPRRGDSVAIIGSGPSGLTAAHDLAYMGYKVTVFEKDEQLGGALAQFVPLYRLPRALIERDLSSISALGVEFKRNCELGKDFTTKDLKTQGYRAILISTGLPLSRNLSLPGFDADNIWLALPFLKEVNTGHKKIDPGKRVIVIGGGNVAIDVARSALRVGASKVRMVCLESDKEMPAFPWEIEETKEEGVEINCSWGPKCIHTQNGLVCGLETVSCTSVFDKQGGFNPTFCEENSSIIEGDIVIVAIGQRTDLSFTRGSEIKLSQKHQIIHNPKTLATLENGVFACGELITGPGMAVEAMASGRQAALSIHYYIQGEAMAGLEEYQPLSNLYEPVITHIKKQERQITPLLDIKDRVKGFEYIELGLTKEAAVREARRCLSCGAGAKRLEEKCIDCLTCVRVCPYSVPVVTALPNTTVEIREDQCQACGICVAQCPARAIIFNSPCFDDMENELERALSQTNSDLLLLYCYYGSGTIPGLNHFLKEELPSEIVSIGYPCVSKIGVSFFLKALQLGANGILILECIETDCIYSRADFWNDIHIECTRELLKGLGVKGELIKKISFNGEEFKSLKEKINEFAYQIKQQEVI